VLQIGRSLFRSQLVSVDFFIDIKSFRSHYGPGVDSTSNRNVYQEYFLGGKGGRCIMLTTYHHPLPLSRNLRALISWYPLGLSRPVMGLLYLYTFLLIPTRTSACICKFCRIGKSPHIIVKYTGCGLLKSNPPPPHKSSNPQNAQIISYLHICVFPRTPGHLFNSVLQSALFCRRFLALNALHTLPMVIYSIPHPSAIIFVPAKCFVTIHTHVACWHESILIFMCDNLNA
jgi:hypothetical protein